MFFRVYIGIYLGPAFVEATRSHMEGGGFDAHFI